MSTIQPPNMTVLRHSFLTKIEGQPSNKVLEILDGADPAVLGDDQCMLAAVRVTDEAFARASKPLRGNLDFYLQCLSDGTHHMPGRVKRLYAPASHDIRMNPQAIEATFAGGHICGCHANSTMNTLSDAFLRSLVEYHCVAGRDSERFTAVAQNKVVIGDRDYFLKILQVAPFWAPVSWARTLFANSSPAIQDDEECVTAALKVTAVAYEHASQRLRSDKPFYRRMLEYFEERGDDRSAGILFWHADWSIRSDFDLFVETLEQIDSRTYTQNIGNFTSTVNDGRRYPADEWQVSKRLWYVHDIADLLSRAGDGIRNSVDIALKIMSLNIYTPMDMYQHFSEAVKKSPEVATVFIDLVPEDFLYQLRSLFDSFPPDVRHDDDVRLAVLRRDPDFFKNMERRQHGLLD